MPHYTSKTVINAPAREVFEFVSAPENMPKYLPTLRNAHRVDEGSVVVQGEVGGQTYENRGWYESDPDHMTMRWGSDGHHQYGGNLQVRDQGDQSFVTVELDYVPNEHELERMQAEAGSVDEAVREGLESALQSVKNIIEGSGGKVSVAAEQHGYMG
jgi:uncharacterized protein YndB with AHSA1/START domain